MAKAIAFATAIRCDQHQPGAKAPGQRPTRPWRALRPRRVGRWPFVVPGPTGLQGTVPRGRGNAVRFMVPPGEVKALSLLQWQGPSPLPQRYIGIRTSRGPKPPASARPATGGRFAPAGSGAGLLLFPDLPVYRAPSRAGGGNAGRVSCSRPNRRRRCPRCNGRGHRPCHSAALGSGPAGGQSPPASARPATGGRFAPAGPGAGLSLFPDLPVYRAASRARGETRVAFPVPARTGEGAATAAMAGAIAPAKALRRDQDQPGATAPGQRPIRPWRALRPRRAGRWPAVALAGRVPVGPWFPTGRENAVRFPLRPERHPPFAKSGAFSHEAYEGGELLSAPCRSIRTLRAAPRAPYGPARH